MLDMAAQQRSQCIALSRLFVAWVSSSQAGLCNAKQAPTWGRRRRTHRSVPRDRTRPASLDFGLGDWIMSDSDLKAGEGITRRLWPTETDKFRDHLLRLDTESRRMRFAHSVSDAFIEDYAGRMTAYGSLVYAYL